MMRMKWVGFVVLALVLVPVVWAFKGGEAAYEEGDVTDGGTIAGAIKFMGTPPRPACSRSPRTWKPAEKSPLWMKAWSSARTAVFDGLLSP